MSSFKKIRKLPKPCISALVALTRCLSSTFRLSIIDPKNFIKRDRIDPVIYAFWHNRLIGTSPLGNRYRREKIAVLISRSRDGEYIAAIIEAFGFSTIRGSSSKDGAKAIRQIQEFINNKHGSIAVTPDGPRGPRYTVQPGIIWIASRTRTPIIPICVNSKSHWQLNSWDQTQIPKPFSKVELIICDPINVGEILDNNEKKMYQALLRNRLLENTNWDN